MDERSPILDRSNPALLSFQPRHQELIPTPCGPRKRWSELSTLQKTYFCFTLVSLLALLGLTLYSLVEQHMGKDISDEDNFTVSLIQLLGILFCVYYVVRGVLQENRQELVAFVLSVLFLMLRSVVNFTVLDSKDKTALQVRFGCILVLGSVHIAWTTWLLWTSSMMAFRVSGASSELQQQYFLRNLCFSMVTFDLQAQLSLCVLITTADTVITLTSRVLLGVGVVWSILTAAVGAVAVLKEVRVLVWIFMALNLPQVAFIVYLMYKTILNWPKNLVYTPEAATVLGSAVSLLIKGALLWGLFRLVRSFVQSHRERMSTPSST